MIIGSTLVALLAGIQQARTVKQRARRFVHDCPNIANRLRMVVTTFNSHLACRKTFIAVILMEEVWRNLVITP